jgi:hypothetical protein
MASFLYASRILFSCAVARLNLVLSWGARVICHSFRSLRLSAICFLIISDKSCCLDTVRFAGVDCLMASSIDLFGCSIYIIFGFEWNLCN